jgi:hypothetical protein
MLAARPDDELVPVDRKMLLYRAGQPSTTAFRALCAGLTDRGRDEVSKR